MKPRALGNSLILVAFLVGVLGQAIGAARAQENKSDHSMSAFTDLIGKHLLIGITFLDANDGVIEQYQTHGNIVAGDERQGIVIEKADGTGRYAIPPDVNALRVAPRGEYRLRSSGEIVVDPDFTSTWEIGLSADREENLRLINDYKIFGFRP